MTSVLCVYLYRVAELVADEKYYVRHDIWVFIKKKKHSYIQTFVGNSCFNFFFLFLFSLYESNSSRAKRYAIRKSYTFRSKPFWPNQFAIVCIIRVLCTIRFPNNLHTYATRFRDDLPTYTNWPLITSFKNSKLSSIKMRTVSTSFDYSVNNDRVFFFLFFCSKLFVYVQTIYSLATRLHVTSCTKIIS